jgi:predicted dehydrogenase
MAPIKVGIIGLSSTGWAKDTHAPAVEALDGYKLTALSTTKAASAAEAGQKYGVKGYHGDTAQIAKDPNVDLVVVSVHLSGHKSAVWPALEAKKDVIVEWPLGKTLAETQEIADFARKQGVRTAVGLQGRQSPAVRKIKQLVETGKIGRVLSSHVVCHFFYYFIYLPFQLKSRWHIQFSSGGGFFGATLFEKYAETADITSGKLAMISSLAEYSY